MIEETTRAKILEAIRVQKGLVKLSKRMKDKAEKRFAAASLKTTFERHYKEIPKIIRDYETWCMLLEIHEEFLVKLEDLLK